MASIDWPVSLPDPDEGDFGESLLETKVQDSGAVGSPRRRNRFTRALERFSFSLTLTEAEKVVLDAFYLETLERGVEAFNWTHPTTAKVYEAILPGKPKATHTDFQRWKIKVDIEEI